MKIKNKKSIQSKTLFYLIIFNITIVVLLWLSQVTIFNVYYEKYQIKNLDKMVNDIKNSNSDDILNKLEEETFNNDVCVAITSSTNYLAKINSNMEGCLLNENNPNTNKMIKSFINSNLEQKTYNFINEDKHVAAVMYAIKYGDKYIFMYSNLEDISLVTTVIKKQLLYLSIVAILIAIILSIFLANKITDPITKITKKAKLLGKGKMNVEFDESDILEIDELSKTLTQAKMELTKTDELRRDLMANVSHDLKTPLTMIKAYAEMIKDISYKDPNKMQEHLDIIIDESDRLTLLVNDILTLSKLQSGETEKLNITEYDLAKEIKNIVKKYDIIKETEQYNLVLDIPNEIMVKADKDKINQVIYNLINNAINYTGDDKLVTIKVIKDKKDYIVKIIDTGKGIKKEEIPYIWNKYYKSDKLHRRNVVSTGLGLAIVKEILEKHDFKYGVLSSNKGTTFYFVIKG